MTGCSVLGCRNRSEHGYIMKKFPSDVKRRAEWAKRVRGNRKNWVPSKSASICEAHFDPSMWEKDRVDGKRALKWNAVPNILEGEDYKNLRLNFPRKLLPILPKTHNKRVLLLPQPNSNAGKPVLLLPEIADMMIIKDSNEEKTKTVQVDPHHTYCRRFVEPDIQIIQVQSLKKTTTNKPKSIPVNAEKYHNYFSKKENIENVSLKIPDDWSIDDYTEPNVLINEIDEELPLDFNNEEDAMEPTEMLRKILTNDKSLKNKSKPQKILLKSDGGEKFLLSRMNQVKCKDAACDRVLFQKERTISLLKKKILLLRRENLRMLKKMNEPTEMLKKIFNEDQLQAMTYKKNTKWSSSTIIKSLELVIACGLKGYKELLRHGLPYPSIRTLQRKLDCDIS